MRQCVVRAGFRLGLHMPSIVARCIAAAYGVPPPSAPIEWLPRRPTGSLTPDELARLNAWFQLQQRT